MFNAPTPTATRRLLDSLGHRPRQRLGQNFLIDGNILRKSVELAEPRAGDPVVEIGPGLGTLTSALLETGAEVHAVERDPLLADHLRALAGSAGGRFHLVEGDCLDRPLAGLDPRQAEAGFRIVANMPYAVATPWMEAVLEGPLPNRMVLMLQKEAAQRYTAAPGSKTFGAISVFLQSAYRKTAAHNVSAACFHPAPKVGSVLLRLDLREAPVRFPSGIREAIRRVFTQRRKQLAPLCRRDPDPRLAEWWHTLRANGFPENTRPEQVPVEYWQYLVNND